MEQEKSWRSTPPSASWTESDAQQAVSRNSVELRILWNIVTGRNDFQGIESTRHPLHKHIEKINEYKRQCGQPELKVEVTYGVNYTEKLDLVKSGKSSGTSANKSSGTSSGKSDKNIYDVIVGGKKLLE